ncbi:hypothetical protein ACF0H5_006419 [Mactra antiquata]
MKKRDFTKKVHGKCREKVPPKIGPYLTLKFLKMSKMASRHFAKPKSSTQIVARLHMKKHLKKIRNKEYSRLRDMVPAIANNKKVSKVTVIEEAVRYIDELHRALVSRLTNTEIPQKNINKENLTDFVHSYIPTNFYERDVPQTVEFEKSKKIPSYLSQTRVKTTRFV